MDPGSGETEAVEPETNATISSLDAANWKRIVEAMAGVVHGPRGTARRINAGIAYRMAGKTGTAQVVGIGQNEEYDADKLDKRFHDHGLFVAFAPVEEPRDCRCGDRGERWNRKQLGGTPCTHRDRRLARRYPGQPHRGSVR